MLVRAKSNSRRQNAIVRAEFKQRLPLQAEGNRYWFKLPKAASRYAQIMCYGALPAHAGVAPGI